MFDKLFEVDAAVAALSPEAAAVWEDVITAGETASWCYEADEAPEAAIAELVEAGLVVRSDWHGEVLVEVPPALVALIIAGVR